LLDFIEDFTKRFPKNVDEYETLLTDNRIWKQRTVNIGVVTPERAMQLGFSGPMLRGSGIAWDLRKKQPYDVYDKMQFDIPVGVNGDCYDRYLVRVEELKQSIRILRQCLRQIPDGPVMVDDPRVALPPKAATYNTIESMIRHFKHIMDGIRVPPGEAYTFVEGGNGELGFFIVADGTGRPYKAYCRSPSFVHLSTSSQLIHNHLIADVVPIFGMINMIGGECDK